MLVSRARYLPYSFLACIFIHPAFALAQPQPHDQCPLDPFTALRQPPQPQCALEEAPVKDTPQFLSFEDWKALQLAQEPKAAPQVLPRDAEGGALRDEHNDSSGALLTRSSLPPADAIPPPSSRLSRIPLIDRFNYASLECSARIHASNPSARQPYSILSSKKDKYMLSPCSSRDKFVVVELCDDIQIDTVQLANFEFFSGVFKDFKISVAQTHSADSQGWVDVGTYRAKNVRGVQSFHPMRDLRQFSRYIRIDFLTHYGNEYYCPVSLLRVYGLTQMEEYKWEEWQASSHAHADNGWALIPNAGANLSLGEPGKVTLGKVEQVDPVEAVVEEPVQHAETVSSSSHSGGAAGDVASKASPSQTDTRLPEVALPVAVSHTSTSAVLPSPSSPPPTLTGSPTQPSPVTSERELEEVGGESTLQDPPSTRDQGGDVLSHQATQSSHPSSENASRSPLTTPTAMPTPESITTAPKSEPSTASVSEPQSDSVRTGTPSVGTRSRAVEASVIVVPVTSPTDIRRTASAGSSPATSISSPPASPTPSSGSSHPPASQRANGTAADAQARSQAASQSVPQAASSASASPAHTPSPSVIISSVHYQPPPAQYRAPAAAAHGGESIYRTIMNRIGVLETNSSLGMRYVEAQTRLVGEALKRLEDDVKRLEGVSKTQQQMFQRTMSEWTRLRSELEMERTALMTQVHHLSDEVLLEKRLGIAQLCLLLTVLVFMAFTRGTRTETRFIDEASPRIGNSRRWRGRSEDWGEAWKLPRSPSRSKAAMAAGPAPSAPAMKPPPASSPPEQSRFAFPPSPSSSPDLAPGPLNSNAPSATSPRAQKIIRDASRPRVNSNPMIPPSPSPRRLHNQSLSISIGGRRELAYPYGRGKLAKMAHMHEVKVRKRKVSFEGNRLGERGRDRASDTSTSAAAAAGKENAYSPVRRSRERELERQRDEPDVALVVDSDSDDTRRDGGIPRGNLVPSTSGRGLVPLGTAYGVGGSKDVVVDPELDEDVALGFNDSWEDTSDVDSDR